MKIKPLCSLLLLLFGASLASAQTITRCGGPNAALYISWPMYQFDVCHTGYNPYETNINIDNVSNLAVAWKYSTGNEVQGEPVLANGVLYFGSLDSYMYAVDARTGTLIWRYKAEYEIFESPAVVNGVLYFVSGHDQSLIYALNARKGTVLWKYRAPAIHTSPTVVAGRLYVVTLAGTLIALNARDGTLLWRYATSASSTSSSPAVVNGVVYFGVFPGVNIYAINAVTGSLLWKQSPGNFTLPSSPALFGEILYVSGISDGVNERLYALNALTGTILWSAKGNDVSFRSTPVIADGVVYVGGSRNRDLAVNTVYAYAAKDGTHLWSSLFSRGATYSLAVANGLIYAPTYDQPKRGLWIIPANGDPGGWLYSNPIASSPIIANGWVYFGSSDHNLYALHLPSE